MEAEAVEKDSNKLQAMGKNGSFFFFFLIRFSFHFKDFFSYTQQRTKHSPPQVIAAHDYGIINSKTELFFYKKKKNLLLHPIMQHSL